MRVIDLRIALEKLDPNLVVMVDMTKPGDELFHFVELAQCEEIGVGETDFDEEMVVCLTPAPPMSSFQNMSKN